MRLTEVDLIMLLIAEINDDLIALENVLHGQGADEEIEFQYSRRKTECRTTSQMQLYRYEWPLIGGSEHTLSCE